jgi:hypothetical protein
MAVPVVRRMLSAAPYSWGVFSAAAAAAGDLGACGDALSLQRRALELLPERSAPALRTELAAALAGYERQCAPAPETRTPHPSRGGAPSPARSPVGRD